MKIYVLGSTTAMKKMVAVKNKLCELGLDGWIHPHYEEMVAGIRNFQLERYDRGEMVQVKIDNDYFKSHYKHILESDAVLVVNEEKREIKNYIGGNVLIEMGQAYVNDKKIFFLNGMPEGLSYQDEIVALEPICLEGQLENIKKYI